MNKNFNIFAPDSYDYEVELRNANRLNSWEVRRKSFVSCRWSFAMKNEVFELIFFQKIREYYRSSSLSTVFPARVMSFRLYFYHFRFSLLAKSPTLSLDRKFFSSRELVEWPEMSFFGLVRRIQGTKNNIAIIKFLSALARTQRKACLWNKSSSLCFHTHFAIS